MTAFDYYDFRRTRIADKIEHEKNIITEEIGSVLQPDDEYIMYLTNRIGTEPVDAPKTMTIINKFNAVEQIEKLDMNEHNKDMDRISYQKPWVKLRDFHKIIKIKEFVANLEYPKKISEPEKEKNRQKILEQLLLGLKEKKIGKNKSEITYNETEMRIEDIDCLTMQNNKYYIDWD